MNILNSLKAIWNDKPGYILMTVLFIISSILKLIYDNKLDKIGKDKNDYTINKMVSFYIYQFIASILCSMSLHIIIQYDFPNIANNQLYNTLLSKVITIPIVFVAFSILIKAIVAVSISFSDFIALLSTVGIAKLNFKWLTRFAVKIVTHKETTKKSKKIIRELEYVVFSKMERIDNGILCIIYYQYVLKKKCLIVLPLPFTEKVSKLFVKDIVMNKNGEYFELKNDIKLNEFKKYKKELDVYHKIKDK